MIQIACPQCGLNLLLPDHLHGQEVVCSGCQGTVNTSGAEKMEPSRPRNNPPRDGDDNRDRDDRDRRDDRDERDRDRERDRQEDRKDDRKDDRAPKPSARATCICLVLAGVISLLAGLIFLGITYYQSTMSPRFWRPDAMPLLVFATILILITNVIPAIFEFIGASCLAKIEGYGLVMTAAVMALTFGAIQTLFCGAGVILISASAMDRMIPDPDVPIRIISGFLLLGGGIFNLVAGGITLSTLSTGPVARIYNRNAEQYNRWDDDDDWDRPRRRNRLPWRRRWYN
jgi:uncharacterized Zn finger protein (UPF0148 family)